MKKILLFLTIIMNHFYALAQNGFPNTFVNWTMPPGGRVVSGHEYGFNASAYEASGNIGNQTWATIDMNGDNKLDLVILAENDGVYSDCFGIGSSPYWKVHLNNGVGFSTSAINWSLPSGGRIANGHQYGFNTTTYYASSNSGNQSWSLLDMNGDNKVDLVVHSQSDGTYTDCFGLSSNPYWKVYLNNGTGFSLTAINWNLPSGGKILSGHFYGFNELFNEASAYIGNQGWGTMDINGDNKPDLIVHSQSDGTYTDCFGLGASPYWKVYINNGSGYATVATNWTLPSGGKILSGRNYGFNTIAYAGANYNGNQSWTILDMNGDSKPDLLVMAQSNGTFTDCFGVGTNPYWKVFWNNGTSFTTTNFNWPLPLGGKILSGHSYGFNELYSYATASNGNQSWNVSDINGDLRPDLVILGQSDGTYADCFSVGNNPYWKVYFNSGSGFSGIVSTWSLPNGGNVSSSHAYGFNDWAAPVGTTMGDQTWTTMDINGDNKADLVLHAEGDNTYCDCFGMGSNPYWKVYINNASANTLHETFENLVDVIIKPNPFEHEFNINLKGKEKDQYQLMIYNLQGQLVQQEIMNAPQENLQLKSPSGIYFYKLYDSQFKHVAAGKLIKQ